MEVAAFILSLAGIGLNFFQDIINIPFMGSAGLYDIIKFMSNMGRYGGIPSQEMNKIMGTLFFIALPAILAAAGGIKAVMKKGGSGYLTASAIIDVIIFLFIQTRMSSMTRDARQFASMTFSSSAPLIWAVVYGIAAACASQIEISSEKEPEREHDDRASRLREILVPSTEKSTAPNNVIPEKKFEPLVGLETESLIKRANLFLEDGQFSDAERYIEQALNQDAEDPRVHFIKLMIINKAHNPEELVEKLDTPLGDEKLFQRALRFADGEYKIQLENFAAASLEKIEQARLQRAARQEARNEENYNKIVELQRNASTAEDFEKILAVINSDTSGTFKAYKDVEEISKKVNAALEIEKQYQKTVKEKLNATSVEDFEKVIDQLQSLKNYKDSEKLLAEAEDGLERAEERKEQGKKFFKSALAVIVIALAGFAGFYAYNLWKTKQAKENVLKLYFDGNDDAAYEAVIKLPDYSNNPAFGLILAHIEYNKRYNIFAADSEFENINRLFTDSSRRQNSLTFMGNAQNLAQKFNTTASNRFLGDIYHNGWGVSKNFSQAARYFDSAAEKGDPYSLTRLAQIYSTEIQDDDRLENICARVISSDNDNIKGDAATVLYNNRDYARAIKIYSAMENHNGMTLCNMGYAYEQLGDKNKAVEFYAQAMKWGNRDAKERHELLTKPKVITMPTPERVTPAPRENITTERNNITFPTAGTIIGEKVNMRISPNRKARVAKQLNSGHPVSVAMLRRNNGEDWYLVKTASGSEGWIYGDYVTFNDNTQDSYENSKRRKFILQGRSRARVANMMTSDKLNIRNMPTLQSSAVTAQLMNGEFFTVYEVFAGPDGDWYRVRSDRGDEGWVFGKYIEF